MARRESTWSRLQMSLFDVVGTPLPVVLPGPLVPRAEAPAAPCEASRTRLLVDAVQRRLPGARVQLTDNKTVLLSQSERDGVRVVRIHQMFLDAPSSVREAMATFLSRGDRKSGRVVDAFIEERGHLLTGAGRALKDGAHRGAVHDLLPMFLRINQRYFGAAINAEIGWGQGKALRRRRTSITFGSWDQRSRRIVIHPVLDQPAVPALCVERVVHHEMLHAEHGERRDAQGRRVVHGPAFRADEARFGGASQADAWFDAHLDALLRWRPGTALRL
ncbi:MAG: hypothetical protein A2138_10120 [Deltaproteobacteria bacterium RBG_16_71_12]|nr:MAG: hypothetical protein A2138_10120 [Deltaproteobacteria bacterium RBG_16_71_12]